MNIFKKRKVTYDKENRVLECIHESDLEVFVEFFIAIQRIMKNSMIKECEELQMEHISLDVKGMSCEHCVKAVESNVGVFSRAVRMGN